MTADVLRLPLGSGSTIPDRADRDWVTAHELADAAGLSYRRVDYATRTGLLHPLDTRRGSGYPRRYDAAQIDRARTLADLLDAGIGLPTCREVIDDLVGGGQIRIGRLGRITLTYNPGDAA